MKKLFMILPLVLVLCFTFSCQKAEEVAEEPAVDVEADVEAIKNLRAQYMVSQDAGDAEGGKMTQRLQVYKCEICGNIVELLHEGQGVLVCCGQPMNLLKEKSQDEGNEKHLPVIEKTENGLTVKVGSVTHPMEEKHYIEWIEIIADGKAYREFLKPGDKPEASFNVKADKITAREHCSVHGLWKKEG